MIGSSTSRLNNQKPAFILKHDINYLLSCFHQLDRQSKGLIDKQSAKILFRSIQMVNYQHQLIFKKQGYSFDQILLILGRLEHPTQPTAYVLSFVKLLVQFRSRCLEQDSQSALLEAEQIDKKIKNIIQAVIQKQIDRLESQNQKAFKQMEINQNKQYQIFELQWNSYIHNYQQQTQKKLIQTIDFRNKSLDQDQNRFVKTTRRYAFLTSTKLVQLQQKKKRLVKQGKYNQALLIKEKINRQKQRIMTQQKDQTSFIANKRFQSLKKKDQSIIATSMMTANNNLQKLMKKKQEGQNIMKIRMKNIRQETIKKLNQNVKKQVIRLKSLFYQALKM